ncbi:MAG TPA: rhodanese-like domain-containing protein, partial [Terriglobia bacterium]
LTRISPKEARSLLDSSTGYTYIDVRTTREFDAGHVPGAKNIPLLEPDAGGGMQLNPRFVEVCEAHFPKDAKLIIGCQKGGRSLRATQFLLEAGFTSVVDMRGGFGGESDAFGRLTYPGWEPRGFPAVTECAPEDSYQHLARK